MTLRETIEVTLFGGGLITILGAMSFASQQLGG